MRGKFAYGADEVDGYDCPVAAAGYEPGDNGTGPVLGQYDKIVASRHTRNVGIVREHEAATAFLQAIEEIREMGYADKYVTMGKEVARELRWIEC